MQNYESSNQLITQLKDRIQQRVMLDKDKHGKLRSCSMDSVMGTKGIIHPESMAVHVSRSSYRHHAGLLAYREWALTHPATRNPAPVVGGFTYQKPHLGRSRPKSPRPRKSQGKLCQIWQLAQYFAIIPPLWATEIPRENPNKNGVYSRIRQNLGQNLYKNLFNQGCRKQARCCWCRRQA